jgi:DNA-directed RNA polymerase alpha subunit
MMKIRGDTMYFTEPTVFIDVTFQNKPIDNDSEYAKSVAKGLRYLAERIEQLAKEGYQVVSGDVYQTVRYRMVFVGKSISVSSNSAIELNPEMRKKLGQPIAVLKLSVRNYNCLKNADIRTVGQLVKRTESEMLRFRNVGKRTLGEFKKVLAGMGLSFGMKFMTGLADGDFTA